MTRDQIIDRLRLAYPGHSDMIKRTWENVLSHLEEAGLTVIPKEPTDEEIERVRRAVMQANGAIHTWMVADSEARAAAAAVRS